MKKIVVIGEILVEIMADQIGEGFLEPLTLSGPFPSGAPAIFIDQVAKLGHPCGIVSSVGQDDFGSVNLSRLQSDGVDISAVRVDGTRPTGSAFVRYRASGARDFIFNIEHSACGHIDRTVEADALFATADHLHVMGSSLSSDDLIAMNLDVATEIKSRGGTLSFDPNLRKEMLAREGMRDAMNRIVGLTDLFLPSGEELTLLTDATEDDAALEELFGRGVSVVVQKKGANGAVYRDRKTTVSVPGFQVQEIDPTGAGDSFGGAFTTCWLRGMSPERALRLAAAAGALAVGKRGPMEGTSTSEEIETFIAGHRETAS